MTQCNNMSKKNKIVMFGHKRIPSRDGGVEIVVEELATRLAKLGNQVTCINRSTKSDKNGIIHHKVTNLYKDVLIKTAPTVDLKGISAVSASFFASIMASFSDCDIVHIHAEGPSFMCWLPKLFGKKVIVTIHGLDHKRAKWGRLASWYILMGEKSAVRYADKIIVLSKSDWEYFNRTYNVSPSIIPNGVNKPSVLASNIIKNKYGLEKDEYILFLGRIVPEKGIHELIEAYNRIKTQKKLVIAGGSSDTNEYYTSVKRQSSLNNNIILTGFVCGEELEELYSNAYLYCLPSHLEGMPLSLLEAMSYGNCCLTSDIDVCKEIMEENGRYFKKGNIDDLSIQLLELCNNSQLVQKYKLNSTNYICSKYNWEDVVIKTLELYNN